MCVIPFEYPVAKTNPLISPTKINAADSYWSSDVDGHKSNRPPRGEFSKSY